MLQIFDTWYAMLEAIEQLLIVGQALVIITFIQIFCLLSIHKNTRTDRTLRPKQPNPVTAWIRRRRKGPQLPEGDRKEGVEK